MDVLEYEYLKVKFVLRVWYDSKSQMGGLDGKWRSLNFIFSYHDIGFVFTRVIEYQPFKRSTRYYYFLLDAIS